MSARSKRPVKAQLRAIQASQHLHTVHRRHTGHVTPHQTTSYPVLAMLLLLVGVFLGGWGHMVTADTITAQDSYVVHASVPGPPPSQPATIDEPHDGDVFTTSPITVSGSCPVNTYESLYRNGAFSGVAQCDAAGHYELSTSLFPGTNQLQVRDYSQTDVGGPLSNIVTVQYNPPVPPKAPDSSGTGGTPSTTNTSGPNVYGEPLIFKTNFVYEGHYVDTVTTWQLDIEGGTAPYAISVEWGDGQHSLLSRPKAGTFTVQHTYTKPGSGYRGSYVTKFSASDSDGAQTILQLLAIVNNPPSALFLNNANGHGAAGGSTSGSAGGSGENVRSYVLTLMKFIWPTYGVAVLLVISFWLGEQREYLRLKSHHKKVRHA